MKVFSVNLDTFYILAGLLMTTTDCLWSFMQHERRKDDEAEG
jgi:hypothetical protein